VTPEQEAQLRIDEGLWKADMVRYVREAVQDPDGVIEVGSGFGVVTRALAEQTTGIVLGFEPNVGLCNQARVRVDGLAHAYVRWAAVSTRAGYGVLDEPPGEPWRSGVHLNGEGSVAVERLDSIVEQVGPQVLVFDCEGCEYALLTGSELPGIRTILVELHGAEEENEQLADHLTGRGYARRLRSERSQWDNVTEWWAHD
jgi:FkbM family methyltransferase